MECIILLGKVLIVAYHIFIRPADRHPICNKALIIMTFSQIDNKAYTTIYSKRYSMSVNITQAYFKYTHCIHVCICYHTSIGHNSDPKLTCC